MRFAKCEFSDKLQNFAPVCSIFPSLLAPLYEFREFGGVPMSHQILLIALNDVTKVSLLPSVTSLSFVEPSSTRGVEPLYQQSGFFITQNSDFWRFYRKTRQCRAKLFYVTHVHATNAFRAHKLCMDGNPKSTSMREGRHSFPNKGRVLTQVEKFDLNSPSNQTSFLWLIQSFIRFISADDASWRKTWSKREKRPTV